MSLPIPYARLGHWRQREGLWGYNGRINSPVDPFLSACPSIMLTPCPADPLGPRIPEQAWVTAAQVAVPVHFKLGQGVWEDNEVIPPEKVIWLSADQVQEGDC